MAPVLKKAGVLILLLILCLLCALPLRMARLQHEQRLIAAIAEAVDAGRACTCSLCCAAHRPVKATEQPQPTPTPLPFRWM